VGFYCPNAFTDPLLPCDAGEQCTSCVLGAGVEYRCVPSQTRDPEGFGQGTADCDTATPVIECDGPEDCFDGEYCVSEGPTLCASEPLFGSCCLSCGAAPECTFCHVDEDCGEAGVCMPLAGEEIGGCTSKPCDDDEPCPAGYTCQSSRCVRAG
jgi:hypothetical protein